MKFMAWAQKMPLKKFVFAETTFRKTKWEVNYRLNSITVPHADSEF